MKVFAISDLHLSSSGEKPMDVFGPAWADHQSQIEAGWREAVGAGDLVLLCGDLSWAMRLPEAREDLAFVEALPGTKYFIQGNHDYWFSAPSRVRRALGPSMHLIRFDAAVHGGVGVCGVRGWLSPRHPDYEPERDERHWRRAAARLRLSLDALLRLEWQRAAVMFHYPPRDLEGDTELSQMIGEAGVRWCVYGHLHGQDVDKAFEGDAAGVSYRCVSADHVGFRPLFLFDI